MAELYQYCNLTGGYTGGTPVSLFYLVASASGSYATDFVDVTSGNNSFGGTTGYSAGTGYDNTTGLGLVKGWEFAQTLCPNRGAVLARGRAVATAGVSMARAQAQDIVQNAPSLVQRLPDQGRRALEAMTNVQIGIRPGAQVAQNEAAAIAALRAAGFTITKTFANHTIVDATAASGTVERFFATEMHDFAQGQYGTRYAPRTQAVIPAAIAPYAYHATLNDLVVARAFARNPRAFLGLSF
jgi:hypothetical protein